jgi:phage terminase large subunit-like protein
LFPKVEIPPEAVGFLGQMTDEERTRFLAGLDEEEAGILYYTWEAWARPKQLPPPGKWVTWMLLQGRGSGKTRTGAEFIRRRQETGKFGRFALIGRTTGEVRDILVEGESGLIEISPPWNKPRYKPGEAKLEWPNGATGLLTSAEVPDGIRGKQFDTGWLDELASWRQDDAYDMFKLALRLTDDPRCVVTTTPKPKKLVRTIKDAKNVVVTEGSTAENLANLPQSFIDEIYEKYGGSRLGQQELEGLLLEDVEGAYWQHEMFDDRRACENYRTIAIGVDPSTADPNDKKRRESAIEKVNECGIVVGAVGYDGHGYILDDRSVRGAPIVWARAVVAAYDRYQANRIVVEANNGGEMVRETLLTVRSGLPIELVFASRNKQTRAEPISTLYQQKRVWHTPNPNGTHFNHLDILEDQMCSWIPGDKSPDRMDALVWVLTYLMVPKGERRVPGVLVQATTTSGWN